MAILTVVVMVLGMAMTLLATAVQAWSLVVAGVHAVALVCCRAPASPSRRRSTGHRLLHQRSDVLVMELVEHPAAVATADHQSEVAKYAELMGDRRALHLKGLGELVDRAAALIKPARIREGGWKSPANACIVSAT